MAKELVILAWCDVCQGEDMRSEGESYTLGIGNGKLLELELCDRHAKPVREVIALLSAHGKPPSDALPVPGKRGPYKKQVIPTQAGPVATDGRRRARLEQIDPRSDDGAKRNVRYCVLCAVGFASEYGHNRHLKEEHGLSSMLTQGELYGGVCPQCGEDTGHIRALSNHATNAHQLAGPVGRLFALAAAEDKYGVVAQTRKRLEESADTLL